MAAAGVPANLVTLLGFGIGMAALPLLAGERYAGALLAILVSRLFDGLDGAVARQRRPSDLGGYLDITCDFVFYSAVVFGFALARPSENALAAAFLIFAFVGTGSSFLAFAIIQEKRRLVAGAAAGRPRRKSFFYSFGLIEGGETIAFLVLLCLIPAAFVPAAWIFGALCWITTAVRSLQAVAAFREP